MKYLDIISEKHRIATIKPEDLEYELALDILKQWKSGIKLSELTLYYDGKEDYLVINKSSGLYETLRDLAITFFEADGEKRATLLLEAPPKLKMSVRVLGNCVRQRQQSNTIEQIRQNYVDPQYRPTLDYMRDNDMSIYNAFVYGVMCGKREERARKKRGASNG